MITSRTINTLGTLVACALLSLLPGARPASAQNSEKGRATRYEVRVPKPKPGVPKHDWPATVRSWRNGFVLGTLYSRESIDIQFRSGVYGWGYAYGDVNRCVWIPLMDITCEELKGHGISAICVRGKKAPRCPAPRKIETDEFSAEKNTVTCPDGHQSKGDGTGTRIKGAATLYPNYSHGSPRGPGISLADNELVYWRYVTKDKRYVMVRTKGERWGFVPVANVPNRPGHTQCPKEKKK
jgi:hypothetical protein